MDQTVCKGNQQTTKVAASKERVIMNSLKEQFYITVLLFITQVSREAFRFDAFCPSLTSFRSCRVVSCVERVLSRR